MAALIIPPRLGLFPYKKSIVPAIFGLTREILPWARRGPQFFFWTFGGLKTTALNVRVAGQRRAS